MASEITPSAELDAIATELADLQAKLEQRRDLERNTPVGRQLSLAITNLEDVGFRVTKAALELKKAGR